MYVYVTYVVKNKELLAAYSLDRDAVKFCSSI